MHIKKIIGLEVDDKTYPVGSMITMNLSNGEVVTGVLKAVNGTSILLEVVDTFEKAVLWDNITSIREAVLPMTITEYTEQVREISTVCSQRLGICADCPKQDECHRLLDLKSPSGMLKFLARDEMQIIKKVLEEE